MRLKNLVGKMAIRTAETIGETNTCVPFSFGFTQPLFPFEAGSTRKYMDKPVKIVAVEESQVVIERDGKRELLERKYVDEHWTDYERLLHPEEEEKEKAEKLIANAKREVEESLIKSLEQNLKENLAKDTIERMNIPEVLKKLSSMGTKQVTGTSLPE